MGIENLYGGHILSWLPGCLSAELHGIGTGKGQLIACLLKKTDLVDSADLYPAAFRFKSGIRRVRGRTGGRYDCGGDDGGAVFQGV